MKPGDIIQIQRPFRVFERELSKKDPKEVQSIVSIMMQPGEIYLLTKLVYHEEDYPQYNYATIELLIAGRTWLTTMTLDYGHELKAFIKKYNFIEKDLKIFESPTLTQRG